MTVLYSVSCGFESYRRLKCRYHTKATITAFQAEDVSSILTTCSNSEVLAVVASQPHKLEVVGSNPTLATRRFNKMEKKLDMIKGPFLSKIIEKLNELEVKREDLVGIFPPREGIEVNYIAIFYC